MADNSKDIITLIDPSGNPVEYKWLGMIKLRGQKYVYLMENHENCHELTILKYEYDEDHESEAYLPLTKKELIDELLEIFKEEYKDEFIF
ncbi:MAG: DUF1292 domain-containing protein [Candidatus Limousia pullorum]